MNTYKVIKKGYVVNVKGKVYKFDEEFQANPADVLGALRENIVEEVAPQKVDQPVSKLLTPQSK